MRVAGFTLVELSVVLILIALLTAAVTVSGKDVIQRARGKSAEETIRHVDRLARSWARRFGGEAIEIDISRDVFTATSNSKARGGLTERFLPGPETDIESVQVFGRGRGIRSSGRVEIGIDADGRSDSYSLTLRERSGERVRLLLSGLSGQMRHARAEELSRLQKAFSGARTH